MHAQAQRVRRICGQKRTDRTEMERLKGEDGRMGKERGGEGAGKEAVGLGVEKVRLTHQMW